MLVDLFKVERVFIIGVLVLLLFDILVIGVVGIAVVTGALVASIGLSGGTRLILNVSG